MEERTTDKNADHSVELNMVNDTAGSEKTAGEIAEPGKTQDLKKRKKTVWYLVALCVICAAGYGYYYSSPAQRLSRALKAADDLMGQARYEEAAGRYSDALEIEPENPEAVEGVLLALTGYADGLASQPDNEARSLACSTYREILDRCDEVPENADGGLDTGQLRNETERKLESLRKEIAATYDALETVTVRDERSGYAVRADGSQKPYTLYYDLVRTEDPIYPYAADLNDALLQEQDRFFGEAGTSLAEAAAEGPEEGDYRDYVGVAGIYTGQGLLSIRMAEVRIQGGTRASYYRGRTFRLADAEEVTIADLTGRTDSGVRRLVKRRIRDWLSQEGYRNISRSAIEDYVEDTEPDQFKFCIRDDGSVCLVIDQEVPFFTTGTGILEIPLEE